MTNPAVTKTNAPDWNFLIETIREGKCILLLGPGIIKVDNGTLENSLLKYLDVPNEENIVKYYTPDELFLFKDRAAQTKVYYKIKKFYANANVKRDIYKNITKIPFHLIISTSPDIYLTEEFNKEKFKHRFEVYDKTKAPANIAPPTQSNPVIYNLFGCTDSEESLVLTHNDLFDFLQAVIGDKNLPTDILNTFKSARGVIFLGCKFEKWYVQLVLRLLKLHNEYFDQVSKYSAKMELNGNLEIEDLCKAQFAIDFIDDDVEKFIETLCENCLAENLLRKEEAKQPELSEFDKVRFLIGQDKIADVFKSLWDIVKNDDDLNDLTDTLTFLNVKFNRLEYRKNNGMMEPAAIESEVTNIINSILNFISSINNSRKPIL